jgi:hypothetical protein
MTAVNGIRSPTLAQAVEEIKGESGSLLTLECVFTLSFSSIKIIINDNNNLNDNDNNV